MPTQDVSHASSLLRLTSSIIKRGGMLILSEDRNGTTFNHLAVAAQYASADKINFMAKHCRGMISLILHESIVDRLSLPLAPQANRRKLTTAFTLSIEAKFGVSTGISAADRAATIAAAIRPDAVAGDVVSPGHVFPVRVEEGEFVAKPGTASASVELCRAAALTPAAVLCSMLNREGAMTSLADVEEFAKDHRMPVVRITELVDGASFR